MLRMRRAGTGIVGSYLSHHSAKEWVEAARGANKVEDGNALGLKFLLGKAIAALPT